MDVERADPRLTGLDGLGDDLVVEPVGPRRVGERGDSGGQRELDHARALAVRDDRQPGHGAAATTTACSVATSGTGPASRLRVVFTTDAPSATWWATAAAASRGSATSLVQRGGAHLLALG